MPSQVLCPVSPWPDPCLLRRHEVFFFFFHMFRQSFLVGEGVRSFYSPVSTRRFSSLHLVSNAQTRQLSVEFKTVLSQLMERLSDYVASGADVLPEFLQVEAFAKLSSAIGKEDLQSLSAATGEKGDDLIRVLRELTTVQRKMADLQVKLQGRKDDKNVARLTHVSEMEKKCETLARITTILKDVI